MLRSAPQEGSFHEPTIGHEASAVMRNKPKAAISGMLQDRLLRLYCPWRDGLWRGSWANAQSQEWQEPENVAARKEVEHTLNDGQTFWINFE